MRKTSVWMSSVRSSPERTSGASRQKFAVSSSDEVADHQPLELGQRAPLQPRVLRADRRVLPHHEEAVEPAVERAQHRRDVRVVAGDLRQAAEAVVVLLRGGVAEVGLQQRDDVLVEVRPPALLGAVALDVGGEVVLALAALRHRQVAGQQVVERRDVGRALDRRVAAEREDAAAGPAHVAEQQLQHRGGADHLHAGGVLRPPDRVTERRRPLAARVGDQRLGHAQEVLLRDAAHLLDHLGRVAREVLHQLAEDGARVLERLVALDRALVHPGAGVLAEGLGRVLAHAGRSRELAALVPPASPGCRSRSPGPSRRRSRRGPPGP